MAQSHRQQRADERRAHGRADERRALPGEEFSDIEHNPNVPAHIALIQSLRTSGDDTSGLSHFATTMRKNVLVKFRGAASTALETFLPVLFVLGLVGIWAAVSDTNNSARNFIPPGAPTNVTDFAPALASAACIRSPNPAVAGIRACTTAEEAGPQLQCYDTPPVAGFCTVIPSFAIIGSWLNMEQPRYIPGLDEMIMMQWIANATVSHSQESSSYQSPISALANGGFVHFTPDTPAVRALAAHLNATSSLFRYAHGRFFPDEASAVSAATSPDLADLNWAVVQVNRIDATGLDVKLRMNRSGIPDTTQIRTNGNGLGDFGTKTYFAAGFLTLQDVITRYHQQHVLNLTTIPPRTVYAPMGFLGFETSGFLVVIGSLAALFLVFGYLYPVSQLTKRIVSEKEERVREAMMIMGLTTAPFYASWLVTYFVIQLVTSLCISILLKVTMLPKSDFFVIFFLYLLFGISNVCLSGLMSAVLSKSRVAALVSPVIFFLLAIPSFVLSSSAPTSTLVLLSLLAPTAFAQGMSQLVELEIGGGATSSNMGDSVTGYSLTIAYVMLGLDIVLYMLLTLYLDAVMPSEWGTRAHPCFCFKWLIDKVRGTDDTAADGEANDGRDVKGAFEPDTPGKKPAVEIRGMRKSFDLPTGQRMVAVDDLNFNMYEDQVYALLGHNGAGKTTAMNCMTGMLTMDAGDVRYHGHSVRHDLAAVRKEIGYCPQHNILWPELTCREHLRFFARLKGTDPETREAAIDAMLVAVDLADKAEKFPGELSGGQKRKLSVGIAFIGGSKVVFLDEPTAGMDVAARRHTWELIKLMTKGRTIVLTTHFMDEADLLGHTIGIMAKGRMKCTGSSLFLKSRLGVGYTLTIATVDHANNTAIIEAMRHHVPQLTVISDGAGELALGLPMASVPAFPQLLAHLEDHGSELGIRGHGISVTTLEEVFLKIGHDDDAIAEEEVEEAAKPTASSDDVGVPIHENERDPVHDSANPAPDRTPHKRRLVFNDGVANAQPTYLGQFTTLFIKRFHYSKRDTRTLVMQILLPVVCITFAMLLTLIEFTNQPKIVFSDHGTIGDTNIAFANCPSSWGPLLPAPATQAANVTTGAVMSQYLIDNEKRNGDRRRVSAHVCSDVTMRPVDPLGFAAPGAVAPTSVVFSNNSRFPHAGPLALLDFEGTWSRAYGSDPALRTSFAIHPLPLSAYESALVDAIQSLFVAIFVLIPFTFIPSTFVSFIVKEREVHALQQQQASGLNFVVYWVSNFSFDIISFVITALLAIVIFAIFGRDEYTGSGEVFAAVFVLMMLYGCAGVAGSYICSFFFESHSTAQNIVMLVNFICGFMLVLLAYILNIIESTKSTGEVLRYFFRIVPSYCLGEGILNLANRALLDSFGLSKGAFDMDVCGWPMLYMGLEFPIFMAIVLYLDSPLRRQQGHAMGERDADEEMQENPLAVNCEDADVAAERREIESGARDQTDLVVVKNLRKYYPSNGGVLAVKDLSFGVHRGEVFGFLGTNGAGKTTTISILCGEQMPTRGTGTIDGKDIVADANATRSLIGYCPQFDATHDLLTVDEHLQLYAGLRGLTGQLRTDVIEMLVELCGLEPHRSKESRSLSGGNRRKLSVAISLMGAPRVVFLDEPSAGMDPMARRQMWEVIQQVAEHCSVVLTTHHLEEIEALASRTAIMVDGTMRCIGSLQHLKSKFGSGFEMSVRTRSAAFADAALSFIQSTIPEAHVQERRGEKLTLQLPQNTRLSQVFSLIEANKDALGVTDYSISQTSLESVFLRISAEAGHAQA